MGKINYSDIVGQRFGKLVVQKYVGHRCAHGEKAQRAIYLCCCDCGNEAEVPRNMLMRGSRITCGHCAHIEKEGSAFRYYCSNGSSFLFDADDYQFVSSRPWYLDPYGYPTTKMGDKHLRLSRLLLNCGEDDVVDHIDGNPQNDLKSNLRIATHQGNQRNMKVPSHNSTGYKGVSLFKPSGKYRAYIVRDGIQKCLGYFDDPEVAARAYDEAARFYFGEFACVNFPRSGEQGCRRNQESEQEERIAV